MKPAYGSPVSHAWHDVLRGHKKGRFSFHTLKRNDARCFAGKRVTLRESVHGIRSRRLIEIYANALERAYERFLAQKRVEPEAIDGRGVRIWLFAVEDPEYGCSAPQMMQVVLARRGGIGVRVMDVIALPSRFADPDSEAAVQRAEATAVHELVHLFNAVALPYRRENKEQGEGVLDTQPPDFPHWAHSWRWLDEGMAVATESEVLPGNSDWLRYVLDWIDRPERSLDHPEAHYQAVMFVRYINRRFQHKGPTPFANHVWEHAKTVWNPVPKSDHPGGRHSALSALMVELAAMGEVLVSERPDIADVFASGYCFDSYFLKDEGKVAERFGERAVTRIWSLGGGGVTEEPEFEYPLDGLACRYFRFIGRDPSPANLTVKIHRLSGPALRAELVLVQEAGERRWEPAGQRVVARTEADGTLVATLPGFSSGHNHAMLVVTNCSAGRPAGAGLPSLADGDEARFRVEARCG